MRFSAGQYPLAAISGGLVVTSRRLGCGAGVAVAGGCGDDHNVWSAMQPVAGEVYFPAGHFADVVAAFTQPTPVGQGGGSAVGSAVHMIEVADGRIAIGIAAGLVPEFDQGG
jgi:hypothetical protein